MQQHDPELNSNGVRMSFLKVQGVYMRLMIARFIGIDLYKAVRDSRLEKQAMEQAIELYIEDINKGDLSELSESVKQRRLFGM